MLGQPAIRLAAGEQQDAQFIFKLLAQTETSSGKPHIVFLGAGRPRVLQHLTHAAGDFPAVLHLISESSDWDTPGIRRAIEASGGSAAFCSREDVGRSCASLNRSLLHHYKISSPEVADCVEVEVHSPSGEGSSSAHHLGWLKEQIAV